MILIAHKKNDCAALKMKIAITFEHARAHLFMMRNSTFDLKYVLGKNNTV